MAVTILTVLRGGGEYEPWHVDRLRQQCEAFAPGIPFRCMGDGDGLRHDWPGWWAKIEAFRAPGPVLYMDLDTTVCGDLFPLLDAAQRHDFIALRDFNPTVRAMGSGLMAWRGDLSWLCRKFEADPAGYMAACNTPRWFGDQGFVDRYIGARDYWQSVTPGAVVSYKKHCRDGVPEGARVVCYHGKPRPWEVE